ncbi:MAG: Gldg family protein [Planctomycetes bacterium]|nr:Gldg family protein [Planctomycetota bacterium]
MKAALALARRDVVRYFTNPTGYVFITVFIFLSAGAQFWRDVFFANNLANLGPLNEVFPFVLLFFVPAIAMGTWADERRQGTEELLLTLPVRDGEVVAGKYLAALLIYTVALFFSLSHVVVLSFLGSPDVGLMFGTYFGYWLLGGALLSIAMFGSLLSESVTVGFILGALFCGVPVVLGVSRGFLGDAIALAGVQDSFAEFTSGIVTLRGLIYFASMTAVGLLINLYLLRRRRMTGGHWHSPVRIACVVAAGASLCVLSGRVAARADVTAEGLSTLSDQTREILSKLESERPVFINAYVSPDVPREYVPTRETLLALLREYDAMGGNLVRVQVHVTEKASDEAREAEEKYKIMPERVISSEGGRSSRMDVYLGAAFTCGLDEVVVPFFYRGLSVEYELTRSIRVVSRAKRLRVGLLNTDAKWFGGFDFSTYQQTAPWMVIDELKSQYEVVPMSADNEITEEVDALVVPLASSLTQKHLDNLLAYVKKGRPTLFLDDPLTLFNPRLNAKEPKGSLRGASMGRQEERKGDVKEFYRQVGFSWDPGDVVWDQWNPHPSLGNLPPEYVFVGTGSGAPDAFNPNSNITSGLQEILLIFPGRVKSAGTNGLTYTPLLRTGKTSGSLPYEAVWVSNPIWGGGFRERRWVPPLLPEEYVLAAQVRGESEGAKINAILICDLDLASEAFFQLRRTGYENLVFDNVTFFLNCTDALVGDEGFIELRKRRPKHRTLEKVEMLTREHEKKMLEEARAAEEKAAMEIQAAQHRLDEKVKEIQKREDLDERSRQDMMRMVQEREQRRFEVEQKRINDQKEAAVARSEANRDREVRVIQNRIKWMALLIPPIPALLIGLMALYYRIQRELEARR